MLADILIKYVLTEGLDRASMAAFASQIQAKHGLSRLDLYPDPRGAGSIELSNIEVPKGSRGKGVGSAAMRDITKLADEHGQRIWLQRASPDRKTGVASKGKLEGFYRKHGFVPNRGRTKDYTLSMYANMYRDPKLVKENLSEVVIVNGTYLGWIHHSGRVVQSEKRFGLDHGKLAFQAGYGKKDRREYPYAEAYKAGAVRFQGRRGHRVYASFDSENPTAVEHSIRFLSNIVGEHKYAAVDGLTLDKQGQETGVAFSHEGPTHEVILNLRKHLSSLKTPKPV